ncbi:MAG: GAF domain-containing protein, partial [Rhodanobacteraceae bacterium]
MPGQERRRGWPQWRGDDAPEAPVGSDSRSDDVSPLSGAIAGQAYTHQRAEAIWRPQETEFDDAQVPQLERLHALGRRLLELQDETALLGEAMQAAADLVRAPCATAQVRTGSGLRLVATSGLPEEYLDPFRYIDQNGITTCAAALRERRRVLVVNFDFAPGFAAFAREAAALHLRAAVSTPVLDENGEVAAMFTLYFDRPFQPTARDLRMLDLCAQQVAPHLQRACIALELKENSSFSRALLDGSIDCVQVLDLHGRVLSINDAGRRLLELDDGAQVEGRYWHELLHPACKPIIESAIAGALAGQPQKFEMFSPTANGKPRWWESGMSRVPDGDAGSDRLLVISRDVTARKRDEQVLSEQQRLLEMIASGCRLPECLRDITEAVSRMDPDARACVLLLDESGENFSEVHSATVPVSFGERICGLRIEGLDNDTCGAVVHSGHPLDCDDIERDHSCSWRELCLEHDVRACHSVPIRDMEGITIGAFLLVFASPGELSRWHARIAEFGAHLAGIAVDRNRDARAREQARHQLADSLQRESSARHDAEGTARDSAWLAAIVTHSGDAIISK